MKHYDLDHFQIQEQREAPDWLVFLVLVAFVSNIFVWAAIIRGL